MAFYLRLKRFFNLRVIASVFDCMYFDCMSRYLSVRIVFDAIRNVHFILDFSLGSYTGCTRCCVELLKMLIHTLVLCIF